jgi:hypothetical protein
MTVTTLEFDLLRGYREDRNSGRAGWLKPLPLLQSRSTFAPTKDRL